MLNQLRRITNAIAPHIPSVAKEPIKGLFEYIYWLRRYRAEHGNLGNDHYEFMFTDYYGLAKEAFTGKKICDIGCGPRGSLEWADNAAQRIGVDPLVSSYKKLGIDKHMMEYLDCPAEKIPLPDEYFDIITSFNSLDHVEDHDVALSEIYRLLKPGGWFLLITEVNHTPTLTEPVNIDVSKLRMALRQNFELQDEKVYSVPENHKFYEKLVKGVSDTAMDTSSPAIYSVKCAKV